VKSRTRLKAPPKKLSPNKVNLMLQGKVLVARGTESLSLHDRTIVTTMAVMMAGRHGEQVDPIDHAIAMFDRESQFHPITKKILAGVTLTRADFT